MTKAGKLEREFALFRKEVEDRLAALEGNKITRPTPTKKPVAKEPSKDIVIEAKEDDIVASDAE